jgi:hypothetical protein
MFQKGSSREKEENTYFLLIADVFFVNLIILFLLITSLYSCFPAVKLQLSLHEITASEVRSTESNTVRSQVSQSDVLNTVSAEIARAEYHKFNHTECGPSYAFQFSILFHLFPP